MTTSSYNIYQQLTSVRLASPSNISGIYFNGPLNNGVGATLTSNSSSQLVIDGINVNINDRVFLPLQTNQNEVGIYIVKNPGSFNSKWIIQRSDDFQSIEQLKAGQYVPVDAGNSLKGNIFVLVEPLPSAIGSGSISFNNVTGSSTGGPFLTVAGNLSDVNNKLTSYQNIGLGGSCVSLSNSDFPGGVLQLTNPTFVCLEIALNSNATLKLPNCQELKSLLPGQSIFIVFSSFLGASLTIELFDGSEISILSSSSAVNFRLDANNTPAGTWVVLPSTLSVDGNSGFVNTVVHSWNGSKTPVDVTAGTGVDITGGVISLTGSGASAAYSYMTSLAINLGSISWSDTTTYLRPFVHTANVSQNTDFILFDDGASHLGVKYIGSQPGVFEIIFTCLVRYDSSNTNTSPNGYVISASVNGSSPINPVTGASNSDLLFFIPGSANTDTNIIPVIFVFQLPLNPNDVVYPVFRNFGTIDPTLNKMVTRYFYAVSKKIGDIGGISSGVTSLNGLTGVINLTSSDSSITETVVGNNISLTLPNVNSSPGTYGTTTQVPTIVVNSKGLSTSISNTNIQISESQVTNLTTDLASKLNLSGGTMTGNLILNVDPTISLQAATKNYVDNAVAGLNVFAVAGASTTNIVGTYNNGSSGVGATYTTLSSGLFFIDGVQTVVGQDYLFKDQTSSFQNGIYTCTNNGSGSVPAVFTREINYDQPQQINVGDIIIVEKGSVNVGSSFIETATVNTIGTDPITFIAWSGSAISLVGDVTGSGTSPVTTTLATVNSNIGTFGSGTQVGTFTVNGKGLITAASNVTISGTPPGGAAGGSLTGTYPNPTIANLAVTNAMIANSTIDLTSKVTGILPILNGGTNSSSQTSNGISFYNGTNITTNSNLTYDGSGNVSLNSSSLSSQISITTTNSGVGEEAKLIINRQESTNGYSQIHLQTSGSEDWVIGTRAGGSIFSCYYNPSISNKIGFSSNTVGLFTSMGSGSSTDSSSSLALFASPSSSTPGNIYSIAIAKQGIDLLYLGINKNTITGQVPANALFISTFGTSSQISIGRGNGSLPNNNDILIDGSGNVSINNGNLNISNLTASSPVFTDGSKNLTSSGTVPINKGGTNITSQTTNGVNYYDGTSINSNSSLTYNGSNTFTMSSTGNNYFVSQSNTVGSSNVGGFKASRGDQTNGFAEVLFQTGSTNKWSIGLRAGDDTLYFHDQSNNSDPFKVALTSGDVNVNTGNLLISTLGKGIQIKSAVVSAGTANAFLVTGILLTTGSSGTINNSAVTTSHVGFANCTTPSGTLTFVRVTCNNGSFTVTANALDNSTYSVLFVKAI